MKRIAMSAAAVLLVTLPAAPARPAAQPGPSSPPEVPLVAAERLIDARPEVLHASEKDEFFHGEVTVGLNGIRYIPYKRLYNGLPVYGGDFVVVTNASGGVLSTSIAQTETLNVSTVPKLTRARAARIARAQLPGGVAAPPRLLVMARGAGILAYEVFVTGRRGTRPVKLHVFIDARTGKVLEKFDEVVETGPMAGTEGLFIQPGPASGDPDCYYPAAPALRSDTGAGVLDHWLHLLSEGGDATGGRPRGRTCNGARVTGIGAVRAGQILTATQDRRTVLWTYPLARKATLEAALQLFPGSCVEFDTVRAAWDAVSVPAARDEPATCRPSTDFLPAIDPAVLALNPGERATVTIATRTLSGPPQPVTFSVYGLPPGATASFAPPSVASGRSTRLTVALAPGTPSGSYSAQILGHGVGVDRTTTLVLTVGAPAGVVYAETFNAERGWTRDPDGTDTATSGLWERGVPQPTHDGRTPLQLRTPVLGGNDLVTGRLAGAGAGAYDIDGGATTIRSREIRLPEGKLTLTFSWYFAHLANSSEDDFLRARVILPEGEPVVLQVLGSPTVRPGVWRTATVDLSEFAGRTIRLRFRAADNAAPSLVEAGVDDILITRS
ncbi:PepSY domain-containing protein [Streptosporangium sp. NPDC004379]|uniref:PepSY domain-containing protein n=1 Tax=Streptosporangium sp. NPDC004379 TaxID=3366189 RepID=UPI0036CC7F9A